MGFLRPNDRVAKPHRPVTTHPAGEATAEKPVTTAEPSAAHPTPSAPPTGEEPDPAEAIVGKWKSETGRDFEAIRAGATVEVRITAAEQFAPAASRPGATR